VDPLVFALVAGAAVMHVTWNVIVKTAGDPLRAATRGNVAAAVTIAPIAVVGWWLIGRPPIPAEALLLGGASGLVQGTYLLTLSAAYRRGGLSFVYPLARGSGTLLAVALGVAVLGERLGPGGYVGVGLLLTGLLALQRPWRLIRLLATSGASATIGGSAVPWALATGACIAVYSAIDRTGSRLVEPWFYAGLLWAGMAATLLVAVRVRTAVGIAPGPELPPEGRRLAVVGGLMALATYFMILIAYRLAPLTAVVPLRESAVVLASAWGALRLGESRGRGETAYRLAASALIVVGAVLLALSRAG
jgi:uncharacterized membrane protein